MSGPVHRRSYRGVAVCAPFTVYAEAEPSLAERLDHDCHILARRRSGLLSTRVFGFSTILHCGAVESPQETARERGHERPGKAGLVAGHMTLLPIAPRRARTLFLSVKASLIALQSNP